MMESYSSDQARDESRHSPESSAARAVVIIPDPAERGVCTDLLRACDLTPLICDDQSDLKDALSASPLCIVATPQALTAAKREIIRDASRGGLKASQFPLILLTDPEDLDASDQGFAVEGLSIVAVLQRPVHGGIFKQAIETARQRRASEHSMLDRIQRLAGRNRSLRTTVAWHRKNERVLRRTRNEAEIQRRSAEEANLMKSKFLASMSHEIRTPLTAIIGLADTLSSELEDEHGYFAHLIEQSGHRLLDTLDSVLILAKLEFGNVELEREALNVFEEMGSLVPHYQTRAADKGLSFYVEAEAHTDPVYVWADKGAFTGIVTNLVDNALKYTNEGEVRISVQVGDASEGTASYNGHACSAPPVYIRITDTGPGIKPEFLQHIFDAFQQESQAVHKEYRGVGLGLSITKRLVQALDGSISVHSEEGVGTTFTVVLPGASETERDVKTSIALSPQMHSSSRLLIVEDDADTRLVYQSVLDDYYDVTVVQGVDEAIDAVEEHTFDALLLDIHLGGPLTGIDLMRILRDSPDYQETPMAAVTAFALPGDRGSMLREGFDAYLSKPFHAEDLISFVDDLLQSKASVEVQP